MIIGQFCETYPPALDGVGRVMLAYCQTLSAMGHRCLYVAPRDIANTATPGCETLLYAGAGHSRRALPRRRARPKPRLPPRGSGHPV